MQCSWDTDTKTKLTEMFPDTKQSNKGISRKPLSRKKKIRKIELDEVDRRMTSDQSRAVINRWQKIKNARTNNVIDSGVIQTRKKSASGISPLLGERLMPVNLKSERDPQRKSPSNFLCSL